MNIDIHTHAKWSKSIDFSFEYYRSMMRAAGDNGLQSVVLTEHFNTQRFRDIYDTLDQYCSYVDHHFVVEGIKVFPGIEVDVLEKAHILVIGTLDSILTVHSKLIDYMVEDNFIPIEQLLDLCEELACVCVGAHPFREANPLIYIDQDVISRLDALDLNGRDLHHYGLNMEQKVMQMAKQVGLPIVGGSDTHQPLQFGSIYNHFEQDCDTIEHLRNSLQQGTYNYCISHEIHSKVQAAEAQQALYKKGHKIFA